jgi:hypothetical protein
MRTKTKTTMLALSFLVAAPGCVHVSAEVDADENVSFDLGDLGTTCEGAGSNQTGSSVTTWTKTAVGDRCQIDVAWNGTLIDMAAVKAQADAQAQGATLTIQSLELDLDDVALRDQNGANVTPPSVPGWEAHFAVDGQPVADFSGAGPSSLLAAPLSFELPDAALALANQDFAAATPLTGAATARLVVEMSDVLNLGTTADPHIAFHFRAHVGADAKKDLL